MFAILVFRVYKSIMFWMKQAPKAIVTNCPGYISQSNLNLYSFQSQRNDPSDAPALMGTGDHEQTKAEQSANI